MAQKRTVNFELDFDIKNLNTIGELEDELSQINDELKTVDVNSEAFDTLSKRAQLADGKLRSVNEQLEGVTSSEKSESVRKLAEGLVGGFQAAAGASLLFGEQTSEELERVIAQVGGLFAAVDGVDKIFKALEGNNVKALKSIVTGFKKSAVAAKLFGSTTKAALTATGIGALIVLIGILIANFDKVKEVVQKNFDQIKKALLIIAPPLGLIVAAIDKIVEKVGDLQNLFAGLGSFIKSVFTFDGEGLQGAVDAFNETVEAEKELDALRAAYNEKVMDTQEAYEQETELLKIQGATQEELLDREEKRAELIIETLKPLEEAGKLTDEQVEALKEAEFELRKIAAQRDNINKKEEEALKLQRQRTKEEQIRGRQRLENLREEVLALEEGRNIAEQLVQDTGEMAEAFGLTFGSIDKLVDEINTKSRTTNDILGIIIDSYDDYLDLQENVIANDIKGNELLEKRSDTLVPSQIKLTREGFAALTDYFQRNKDILDEEVNTVEKLGEKLSENTDIARTSLEFETGRNRIKGDFLTKAANELALYTTLEELNISIFEKEKEALKIKRDSLLFDQQITQGNVRNLEITKQWTERLIERERAKVKIAKTEEEIIKSRNLINRLTEQTSQFDEEIANQKEKEKEITEDIEQTSQEIVNATGRIMDANARISAETTRTADNLVEQSRLYKDLQDLAFEYGQIIAQGTQESFELFNNLRERRQEEELAEINLIAEARKEALDLYLEQYKENIDAIKEENKDLADQEEDLNELLRDAEGDRYNDIIEQLNNVQAQREANAAAEAELERQKAQKQFQAELARWRADKRAAQFQEKNAKAEKAQAITLATIQTTLAVIEALPNVILSAAVGILGGIGVAAIASQNIPPAAIPAKPEPPMLEEGGFLSGPSHARGGIPVIAEGGEYVVNKDATSKYRSLLEAINAPKFANGGIISESSANVPNPNQDLIDYERLGAVIAKQPVFASWTEGRTVGRKLTMVESRASI